MRRIAGHTHSGGSEFYGMIMNTERTSAVDFENE